MVLGGMSALVGRVTILCAVGDCEEGGEQEQGSYKKVHLSPRFFLPFYSICKHSTLSNPYSSSTTISSTQKSIAFPFIMDKLKDLAGKVGGNSSGGQTTGTTGGNPGQEDYLDKGRTIIPFRPGFPSNIR